MGRAPVILADTTVVIDLLRSPHSARSWFAGQHEVIAASEVTRTEVLAGMRSSGRRATVTALERHRWSPVDAPVSTRTGELGRRYRASHDLDIADLLVAATAEVHGAGLATSDVEHFPMVKGLQAPC